MLIRVPSHRLKSKGFLDIHCICGSTDVQNVIVSCIKARKRKLRTKETILSDHTLFVLVSSVFATFVAALLRKTLVRVAPLSS